MTSLTYLDFDLAIETIDATANRHRVRILNSPVGQASGDFGLPFDARDLELLFLRLGRPRRGGAAHWLAGDGCRAALWPHAL